jgi:hypothetical protein
LCSVTDVESGEIVATIGESYMFKLTLNNQYCVECAAGMDRTGVLALAICCDTCYDDSHQ